MTTAMTTMTLGFPCDADERPRLSTPAARLFSAANVPQLHARKMQSWREYKILAPGMALVRDAAIVACDSPEGSIIGLLGARGVGKTQLATLMALTFCRDGRTARYTTAADMFLELRSVYQTDRPAMTEREALDTYLTPRLLVIDELQEWRRTEREQQTFTSIIDHRYTRPDLTTVLIANMTNAGLAANIGPSARRRMEERGKVWRCDWPPIMGTIQP